MTELNIQELVVQQDELKRCITRLSYAGMGISSDLDGALKLLRENVKSNSEISGVSASIESISKILMAMDDELESKKIEVSDSLSDFLKLIQDNRIPENLKQKLNLLQANGNNEEAIKISRSMIDVILNHVGNVANIETLDSSTQLTVKTTQEKNWLQRLFSKKQPNHQLSASAIEQPGFSLSFPLELRTSLKHLTDQLSAIEHYREIAEKLAEKVESLTSIEELAEILELITGAFINLASHEHEQLERFLKSLDSRIERVNGFILNTVAYSKQVNEDSRVLNHDLTGSVSEMKQSMDNSSSLAEVKQGLYSKMDLIVERVKQFYSEQAANHSKLNQNIESLQEQLRATEDESSRLREEFAEQRMRAQTDPLTHLPNRYSYNERLTQEYNRWRRYRSPLSLVICDIDFFKRVNDQYGHTAGDVVLKKVAHYLQASLRESDFVARYGGEEFIMLLPETPIVDAAKAMNKLRQGVSELKVDFEGQTITTAISIGISEFENTDTPKAVFKRADKALYRAKEKGRNQVCCQRAKSIKD